MIVLTRMSGLLLILESPAPAGKDLIAGVRGLELTGLHEELNQRQVLVTLHKHIVGSKSLVILYTNPVQPCVSGSPPSHLKQGLP